MKKLKRAIGKIVLSVYEFFTENTLKEILEMLLCGLLIIILFCGVFYAFVWGYDNSPTVKYRQEIIDSHPVIYD